MKSNKGITLVALIITIIVLLILAGVSISLVVGDNGVMNQAQKAAKRTDLASAQSALELTLSSVTSTFLGDVWENNTSQKIADNVTVYDLDKELQNNGFYIVSFGGSENSANNSDTKTYYVKDDKDTDDSTGEGTNDKPYKTTIVIAEGTPGDTDHSNKDGNNKGIKTTYKTKLEWTNTSVRICGIDNDTDDNNDGWVVGNDTGIATTVKAPKEATE